MKKIKTAQFVGRQLSRLRAGQTYYVIATTTITALGIVKMAYPRIDTLVLIFLFPIMLLGAFVIGYLMDIWNVTIMDRMKNVEMSQKYVNIQDLKAYEFQLAMMGAFFKWIKSIQDNKPLDLGELEKEYKKFLKRWKPRETR